MHKAIRYIGSKQKMLPFLEKHIFSNIRPGDSFFEGFAGSAIVSQYVAENYPNVHLSASDISNYSGVLFNILNIGECFKNTKNILDLIKEFETTPLVEGPIFNEFSHTGIPVSFTQSRNFFHANAGKTMDTFKIFISQKLKQKLITPQQSRIMLYFLVSYCCRISNTTSVFGAFLKGEAKYQPLNCSFVEKILKDLVKIEKLQYVSKFYLGDIVSNLKLIAPQTFIYLDPPYSTRRYESNYHILNYVLDLNFTANEIKVGSKTGQPKIMADNPFAQKKQTHNVFEQMIEEGVKKSNLLAISYNTDGIVKQDWMESYCLLKGYTLETQKLSYKRFKSKIESTNTSKLEEILWIIKK